jgi:oligopeptide transport system substrate-binding protein
MRLSKLSHLHWRAVPGLRGGIVRRQGKQPSLALPSVRRLIRWGWIHLHLTSFGAVQCGREVGLALFSLAMLSLAACGPVFVPDSTPSAAARPTGTDPSHPKVLRIYIGTAPDVLDPQKASSTGEIAVLQLVYEGLTRFDETGRVAPGAAQSWEYSDSGKTIAFHLRRDLIRADGASLNARDFEYAFKRALDPRIIAPDQSFLDDVKGAIAAYSLDPKSKPDDIQRALDGVSINATDDFTLVVSLNQASGVFPAIAATWVGMPAERGKIESDPDAWWAKPENHNGNGPFKISEVQEQVIKLVRNPYYWAGGPRIERIELYWSNDGTSQLASYRDGDLDVVQLSANDFTQASSDLALRQDLVRIPAARETYLGFNLKKPPFSDRAVRLGFAQAIDRVAFVRDVLKGLGKPASSWIPLGIPGYDESAAAPVFDAKAAIQTVATSSYGTADKKRVDCTKLGTVKLSYSNTPRNQSVFQSILGSLARTFGCPILLDPIEPNDYPIVVRDPRTTPQVYLITWEQEYPHPQNWLFLQSCNGVFALRLGYCNKDFDSALAAASQETDPDRALDRYKTAQKIFMNDNVGIFLWSNENAYLVKPYVLGPKQNASASDSSWLGQFGPIVSYDIDTTKVGSNYPSQ